MSDCTHHFHVVELETSPGFVEHEGGGMMAGISVVQGLAFPR